MVMYCKQANPADERARFKHDTDKEMTLLRLDAADTGRCLVQWWCACLDVLKAAVLGRYHGMCSCNLAGHISCAMQKPRQACSASIDIISGAWAR
jgi:hypothetical protein